MDLRSSLRGKLGHPTFEQRPRVMRAWAGFRMELHRPRALRGKRETLDRAVIQRDMRHLGRFARVDAEAVVLRRDEHASARSLEHWVVCASMAERKLGGTEARRTAEQL